MKTSCTLQTWRIGLVSLALLPAAGVPRADEGAVAGFGIDPGIGASRLTASGMFAEPGRAGAAVVRTGIGFTADPGTFLLAIEGSYFVSPEFSVGPLVQFGISDDPFILAPTANFRYSFDVDLGKLMPFIQGGLGFAYLHDDRRHGDDDEAGFLLNFGFGVDVLVGEDFSLGSSMLFNVLPDEVLDQHFFFSWQVLTFSFHF